MNTRATLISVLAAAIVAWLIAGLYHLVLVADMEREANMAYQSVMYAEGTAPPIVLWLIPMLLLYWLVLYIMTRGNSTVNVGSGVKTGMLVSVIYGVLSVFNHWMLFTPTNTTLMIASLILHVVSGAVAGAVLGFTYSKLNK